MGNCPPNIGPGRSAVELVPIDEALPCKKCGEPALWRTPRQKTKGLHPTCTPFAWMSEVDANAYYDAIAMVASIIGVESIEEVDPARIPIKENEIGPCAKCQTRHRRYGPYGKPLCPNCEEVRR